MVGDKVATTDGNADGTTAIVGGGVGLPVIIVEGEIVVKTLVGIIVIVEGFIDGFLDGSKVVVVVGLEEEDFVAENVGLRVVVQVGLGVGLLFVIGEGEIEGILVGVKVFIVGLLDG